MRRAGLNPAEYMLDKIPVLPAQFRPVSSHNGLTMVADANYLYAQLLDARDDMRDAKDLPQEYQDKARENLYRTWQELVGLYDPEDIKLRNKNVSGLLKWALGTSPKFSAFQRKVLGGSVDTVGRGAIVPNAKLTVDQIGIPIGMAFGIMAPFVERGLVQRGYTPVDAMKMVKKQDKRAEDVLREVVKTHPVEMNRAPTLHKFNIMAFEPVLVQGHAIQVHPSVCPGFGADFDGDTVNVHVPISDNARREAMAKMRPSRNLIAPSNRKIMYKPEKEYMQGLYIATRMGKSTGRPPIFRTYAEAKAAQEAGAIDYDTPVYIMEKR
jgi:DNA-directed RNA polymerase subunit beta'